MIGTAAYMSPEQVQGKPVDHRSDVFSFGCILYEAADRARPFVADSAVETMHKILNDKPAPIEDLDPLVPPGAAPPDPPLPRQEPGPAASSR